VAPEEILEHADRCVKCGLCLPHCPTYSNTRDESESPRGRIALVQGWLSGALEPTPRLLGHLDRCLECRACETACPSGVAYGAILDAARQAQQASQPVWRRAANRWYLDTLSRPGGVRLLSAVARGYRGSGLRWAAQRSGLIRLLGMQPYDRLVERIGRSIARTELRRPTPEPAPSVALFTGCLSQITEPRVLQAAARLLGEIGFRVDLPAAQACCGALHRHAGFAREADRLLERNAATFGPQPIVSIATACAAELQEHAALGPRTHEICEFLGRVDWPAKLRLAALPKRVAVHEPCSQRNRLGSIQATYDLLGRIPRLQLIPLPDNQRCCGGAGTYMLRQPASAQHLLGDKLRQLRAVAPDILVTANTGCALQLAAGVREAGLSIEVCHPVELLVRQLQAASGTGA
jgi:glycolate oxidase iron-sulfur subunit